MFPHIADRHFYSNGACCLWMPVESQWELEDATGLHSFLDQIATFYERQLIYDSSPNKRWAWGQRGHGIVGYIEFVQEALGDPSLVNNFAGLLSGKEILPLTSNCPCESGKKYKYCHARTVSNLTATLGSHNPFLLWNGSAAAARGQD